MNVVKIVVDKLPESCDDCKFSHDWFDDDVSPSGIECEWTKTKVVWRVAINHRASDCPLQVEEVCEWEEDDEKQFYHFTDCGSYIDGIGYIYCAHCGKRVKYVEVE